MASSDNLNQINRSSINQTF